MDKDRKLLIDFLKNNINKCDCNDKEKALNICNLLEEKNLPSNKELDKIQKDETDLEIKYEFFNELSNYFDPVYINLKRKNHEMYVKNLRNRNKK